MEIITAFKASDGSIFESKEKAEEYEGQITINKFVEGFYYKHCDYPSEMVAEVKTHYKEFYEGLKRIIERDTR